MQLEQVIRKPPERLNPDSFKQVSLLVLFADNRESVDRMRNLPIQIAHIRPV